MPPAAFAPENAGGMDCYPMMFCAFDSGEIEVQPVEGREAQSLVTRILVMMPGSESEQTSENSRPKYGTTQANGNRAKHGSSQSQYDYLSLPPNSPGGRSLADSFDSTDEIVANSNEAKLIQRIVEKRAYDMAHPKQSGFQSKAPFPSGGGDWPLGDNNHLRRQDSMSDTNSVNSNDVFFIDPTQEMDYLDVLDHHLVETNPAAMDFSQMDNQMDDCHPRKHHANLDEIMDHLCAGTCVLSEPPVEVSCGSSRRLVAKPKSVLRKPKWTKSPNDYSDVEPETDWACSYPSSVTSADRNVRFHVVEIREFKMTLGNHPSATSGPPVMLDWELFSPRKVLPLEKYETSRAPRRKRRQLKLSLHQRHNILVKERGFSFDEVKAAWQEALEIRKQRKETLERGCVGVIVHAVLRRCVRGLFSAHLTLAFLFVLALLLG
jgi:hypothetical protein